MCFLKNLVENYEKGLEEDIKNGYSREKFLPSQKNYQKEMVEREENKWARTGTSILQKKKMVLSNKHILKRLNPKRVTTERHFDNMIKILRSSVLYLRIYPMKISGQFNQDLV